MASSDRDARRAAEYMKLFERESARAARSQKLTEANQQRQAKLAQFEDDVRQESPLSIPSVPTFTPTAEEWADPVAYVSSKLPIALPYGGLLIQPPPGWEPNSCKLTPAFRFRPRLQTLPQPALSDLGRRDSRTSLSSGAEHASDESLEDEALTQVGTESYGFPSDATNTLAQFRRREGALQKHWAGKEAAEQEKAFWRLMASGMNGEGVEVRYGVDVEPSSVAAVPAANSAWTLSTINSLGTSVLRHLADWVLPGISTPMMYIGSCFARFCMHTEDAFLCSMSYLHTGAQKTWYLVPADHAIAAQEVVRDMGVEVEQLLHKSLMVDPRVLQAKGVPVYRVEHRQGQIAVTLPQAYHWGLNHGQNVAEAVNWAMIQWLPYGCLSAARDAYLSFPSQVPVELLVWSEACGDVSGMGEEDLKALLQSLKTLLKWQRLEDCAAVMRTCDLDSAPARVKELATLWSVQSAVSPTRGGPPAQPNPSGRSSSDDRHAEGHKEATTTVPSDGGEDVGTTVTVGDVEAVASHLRDPRCSRCFHICHFGQALEDDFDKAEVLCGPCSDQTNPHNVLYLRYPMVTIHNTLRKLEQRLGPAAADVHPMDLDAMIPLLLCRTSDDMKVESEVGGSVRPEDNEIQPDHDADIKDESVEQHDVEAGVAMAAGDLATGDAVTTGANGNTDGSGTEHHASLASPTKRHAAHDEPGPEQDGSDGGRETKMARIE